jgi:hypothetical protein
VKGGLGVLDLGVGGLQQEQAKWQGKESFHPKYLTDRACSEKHEDSMVLGSEVL